jgi:hypothetical protein
LMPSPRQCRDFPSRRVRAASPRAAPRRSKRERANPVSIRKIILLHLKNSRKINRIDTI